MNKIYYILFLMILSSCKMNKENHVKENELANDSIEQPYDQSEGMEILDTLGKVYGNDPHIAGLSLETPNCPDFIEGIYFDKSELVFQVTGDTAKARQELEKAAGNKHFRIELTGGSNYSQKQLLALKDELSKKLEKAGNEKIRRNITGYGVGLHHVEITMIMNTPEKRKEFREKVMDSPAFHFNGTEVPIINEKVGSSDTLGIYIRPEYPVYSTEVEQATFILNNFSGKEIECGEHYYITFKDEKGIWRELPMNANFFDIGYVILNKGERTLSASLYPDVHPNKPGLYRYFYKITIAEKPILMMAEFRLTDNENEWKKTTRTPLPESLMNAMQKNGITPQTGQEPVYEVVENMPEFPGGMKAMLDFISKNIQYPESARQKGVQGKVIVKVVIDKDGAVTQPILMRSLDSDLDKEALRIVKLMPKWKPGTQRGKAVKVEYTFPVIFKLDKQHS